MTRRVLPLIALVVLGFFRITFAAEPSMAELIKLNNALTYQSGDVKVGPAGLATLHLGKDYRFLGPEDARKVICDAWGNPPGSAEGVLGMITPPDESPLAGDSWGVVVTYKDEGHIDDGDAKSINYGTMLTDLKGATESANAERKQQGYGALHLVGWARTPAYDESAKKLIWAKELAFGDLAAAKASEHSLNYDVRVLGRRGILSLNAVGTMSQLPQFETVMSDVSKHAEFNAGERYADFDHKSDKMAAYGVAGLIVGGVAAKAGLFKGLLIALIALKKFLIIGVVALVAAIKKIFGGGTKGATPATTSSPTDATPIA